MFSDCIRRRVGNEDGFALIAAITMTAILMVFTMGMLATGTHLNEITVRDTSWNRALQVAEAGAERALHELSVDDLYAGSGSATIAVPGGEAEVTVTSSGAGNITVHSTGWVPSRAATNAVKRRVQANFGPADVFSYALFSTTGLFVKNNGVTRGDVFANSSIIMESNSTVYGSVTSATGTIRLDNGARILSEGTRVGNAYSGGYDPTGLWGIRLTQQAEIGGAAFAEAEACPGSSDDNNRYNIVSSGLISGGATARGAISGSVIGQRTPYNCILRHSTRELPTYTWDPSLYTGEIEWTSATAFNNWVAANSSMLSGVHHVWVPGCDADGSGDTLQLGGTTIPSELVLVTNCKVDFENSVRITAPTSEVIELIVLNSSTTPPAVDIKNNFEVAPYDPAVLLYSTGLIQVKNNPDQTGAVYAGAISVKNNLNVTYDPRVRRTLGFGDVKYTRVSWQECRAATTGTDC